MVLTSLAPAARPALPVQPARPVRPAVGVGRGDGHGWHLRTAHRPERPGARIPAGPVRALAVTMIAAGLGLLPWMVYLAVSLPASPRAWHWPAAWVGLDALEAAGLAATGVLLRRGDARYCLTAIATSAFLITDAWFDVTTAPAGSGVLESAAMALFAELPTAAVCAVLAWHGLRQHDLGQHNLGQHDLGQHNLGQHNLGQHNLGQHTLARPGQRRPQVAGSDRLGPVRVLVIGSGGREHALARALARDSDVAQLHAAPGNPGIAGLAELHKVNHADPVAVADLAAWLRADLVVVGPEAPLVAGVADAVRSAGVSCFGPSQDAAMVEGSKSFAKDVMTAAGIPTARARTCRDVGEVAAALDEFGPPYVVKADGLAAGKGVVVTSDRQAAIRHAAAAGPVVIEEFLDGPEVSIFAVADGATAVALLPAQDYKRAHDGDQGPNTGGMGAYAPLPWAPAGLAEETMETVVQPALAELRRRGTPFSGLLYTGLCLTAGGLRVVEFNARFGDPETQVVLDRLATPLGGLLRAAADGDLAGAPAPKWEPGSAVSVVIAAEGYPAAPVGGDAIEGLDAAEGVPGAYVLHAGTSTGPGGELTSAGGRVLNVVGTGDSLGQARSAAYQAAGLIRMRGGWFRRDIAEKPAAGTTASGL
jgi:phosphoribosylamine---glycine ligase